MRILIVDDGESLRSLLTAALKRKKHVIVADCGTVQEGITACLKRRPDLAIIDIVMPGGNGLDIIRAVAPLRPKIKWVCVTGYSDSKVLREARILGVHGFLEKPFTLAELLTLLKAVRSKVPARKPVKGLLPSEASFGRREDKHYPDLTNVLAEIVGGFCHDFGNALSMLAFPLFLRSTPDFKGRREIRALLPHLHEELTDLHHFIRPFYKHDGFGPDMVEVSKLRETVIGIFRAILPANIDFEVTAPGFGKIRNGVFPRVLLRHLLTPLIFNSREVLYRRKTSRGNPRISVSIRPLFPDGVAITVVDNGTGWNGIRRLNLIRESVEKRQRIRGKGASKGFGLQNLARLVSRLGGYIALGDAPSGGAKVEVRIPWRFPNEKR
jgi:CheY-like chemotaxis protein